jgi:hypothetical protein
MENRLQCSWLPLPASHRLMMNVMAKNGEVALRLQPGGGLYVPCYPAVYKSGRRRDRGRIMSCANFGCTEQRYAGFHGLFKSPISQ